MKYGLYVTFVLLNVLFACSDTDIVHEQESLKNDLKKLLTDPKHYICYRLIDSLSIDGVLSEQSWQKAEWTDYFQDIEGDGMPKPYYNTRAKMLWDDKNLYIAAELEDEHIWAYLKNQDDIVFYDNDFEIFIDPDNDALNYFEFEINAAKAVFDLFLARPYRTGAPALHTWDFKNMIMAVKIDGTLNNGNDNDKKWTIELAIPFSSLAFGLNSGKPDVNKPWRIDFSRVEWNTKWENGKYMKVKDEKTGKPKAENNWIWSPPGLINMHMPERWGYLKFSENKAGTQKENFEIPKIEELKKVLWAVFYREEGFYLKNKKFSSDIAELGSDINSLFNPKTNQLTIKTADLTYEAKLKSLSDSLSLYITQEGKIEVRKE